MFKTIWYNFFFDGNRESLFKCSKIHIFVKLKPNKPNELKASRMISKKPSPRRRKAYFNLKTLEKVFKWPCECTC